MAELVKNPHPFGIDQFLNATTSGLALFRKCEDGRGYCCVEGNESAGSLTGYETLVGMTWENFAKKAEKDSASTTREVPRLDFENYFRASKTWCRLRNTPIDETHFLCTLTDVSRYKEIESKDNIVLGILRDAEKTVQFGTWIWYHASQVVEWSEGLYVLLGYGPQQANQSPATFDRYVGHIHPDDLERVLANIPDSLESEEPNEIEYRITTLSGEEKHVFSRSNNHKGDADSPPKLTGCVVDITSIKVVRNQLLETIEELNRSNSDLEQFAYVASHDLQEPLRKIVSFGERLEKRGKAINEDEEAAMYLDRILSATRRMQTMINTLLDFSRLTQSRQEFEKTDLNSVARGVVSDLEIAIKQKDAIIEVAELPVIEAIPSQMAQLFMNLISNSLKFTGQGTRPLVSVRSENLSSTQKIEYGFSPTRPYVRLVFSDNGIGFDNTDASRIFTIFQRLRGRSEFEGAGIGLSVCKKVVENHNGIIMASGQPGVGATFTVLLPVAQFNPS